MSSSIKTNDQPGPIATVFAWIGLFTGGAAGLQLGSNSEDAFIGMCIGAIATATFGAWVGRIADAILLRLIFVGVVIVQVLINNALRKLLWSLFIGG